MPCNGVPSSRRARSGPCRADAGSSVRAKSRKTKLAKLKLDELNLRILEILQGLGRITFPRLSEKVGLSTSPCFMRVRRLEEAGFINGYFADINLETVGPHVKVLAAVVLDKHEHRREEEFRRCIRDIPEIVSGYQVSGPYDYQLLCVCPDIAQYQEVATKLFEAGVTKLESLVILKTIKEFSGYPLRRIATFRQSE